MVRPFVFYCIEVNPLQLSEYQWSGNPRGMHNEGAYKPINYNRLTSLHLGWYKLVTGGEEFANDCVLVRTDPLPTVGR